MDETGASPVYFRDLNKELHEATLEEWIENNKKGLLKANEKGIDIIIGYYRKIPRMASIEQ